MTATTEDPRQRLILALDVDDRAQARDMVRHTVASVGIYKVGLQLFVAEGPDLVRELVAEGARVFLDLKLHDIPNTVAGAARQAARLGAAMFTVHCANGARGLAEALGGLREFCARERLAEPLMLGVTVLTSMSDADLHGIGAGGGTERQVEILAGMAYRAGLRGFVASPLEAAALRQSYADAFIVTPGIRPAGADAGDQARITTPRDAIAAGASAIVVGRPILRASDPGAAAAAILAEIRQALAG